MARRVALLIGNKIFEESEHFSDLRTPESFVRDLAEMLKKVGEFEDWPAPTICTSHNVRLVC